MTDLYISGPMTGKPYFNFDAFFEAEKLLEAQGYKCLNPAREDEQQASLQGRVSVYDLPDDYDWNQWPDWLDREEVAQRDLDGVRKCDGIYMLDGWRDSDGALAEYHVAKWLGRQIMFQKKPKPQPGSAEWRKQRPVWSGYFDYFPDAIASMDNVGRFERDAGALFGCLMKLGQRDFEGVRYSVKAALQSMHVLQKEIEEAGDAVIASEKYSYGKWLISDFPDAVMEVAHASWVGNEQHNPGEPLHWSRHKSSDHQDCAARHFLNMGTFDDDDTRHTAKLAWRLHAVAQLEIEGEK